MELLFLFQEVVDAACGYSRTAQMPPEGFYGNKGLFGATSGCNGHTDDRVRFYGHSRNGCYDGTADREGSVVAWSSLVLGPVPLTTVEENAWERLLLFRENGSK